MIAEYFVIGYLCAGFVGMIPSFSLLGEIYAPVYSGWKRVGIIAYALLTIFAWFGGLTWLFVKYST
jgi:hypothetical protein